MSTLTYTIHKCPTAYGGDRQVTVTGNKAKEYKKFSDSMAGFEIDPTSLPLYIPRLAITLLSFEIN